MMKTRIHLSPLRVLALVMVLALGLLVIIPRPAGAIPPQQEPIEDEELVDTVVGTFPADAIVIQGEASASEALAAPNLVYPVSVMDLVSTNVNISVDTEARGWMHVSNNSGSGVRHVYLTSPAPAILYGIPVKFSSATICYDLEDRDSFITSTEIRMTNADGSATDVIVSDDDHHSKDPDCYTVGLPAGSEVTITGPLFIRFGLDYDKAGSDQDIRFISVQLQFVQ
jgi:hypothetical protein